MTRHCRTGSFTFTFTFTLLVAADIASPLHGSHHSPFATSHLTLTEILFIFILYADMVLSSNQIVQLFEPWYDTIHSRWTNPAYNMVTVPRLSLSIRRPPCSSLHINESISLVLHEGEPARPTVGQGVMGDYSGGSEQGAGS